MPFTLPDHVEVNADTFAAIADRHGVADGDATIEARIVWHQLHIGLLFLPRGAVPGRSWAERPIPMLLEILRFFMEPPDEGWREVGPVAQPQQLTTVSTRRRGGRIRA